MINSAKRSIKIATPYLILEPEMMISLKIAAQSGVAIDILVPGKSDYAMVGFATRSYYETLLSYGIRVHEYKDTFVHSKILIIDDEIASVGSVNFDPRSFHLTFEATAVFENAALGDLVAAFAADLEKAPSIDLELVENGAASSNGSCRDSSTCSARYSDRRDSYVIRHYRTHHGRNRHRDPRRHQSSPSSAAARTARTRSREIHGIRRNRPHRPPRLRRPPCRRGGLFAVSPEKRRRREG
ncbi:MAG: phospholipase D-like domain-containing protein [Bacillus subtilis]|nr:phospholipase D-like domain-containing protein [Bacillus subtilis]